MEKKIIFSMVCETDIRYYGGTEKTLLNYFKYVDKSKIEPYIFDTNILDKEKLTMDEIKKNYGLEETVKFKYPNFLNDLIFNKKYGISTQKKSLIKDIFLFLNVSIKFFSSRIFNRKQFKKLMQSDVIYAVSDYQIFYLFLNKLFRKKGPKIILGTHNYLPIERRFLNKIENYLINKITNAIHYQNPAVYEISRIKRKNDFIINSGVNTELFHPSNEKQEKIRFLFVGRLVKYKGIMELINAWKIFPEKDKAELHIAGKGELEEYIKNEFKNDKSIIYHGFVSDDELPKLYSSCDVLVFPTYGIKYDEYFGLVVIEALASGNYVLVGEGMKGTFDYFEQKGALEYIKLDPEIISKRILFTLNNVDELKKNVINVRNYIDENYNWKSISLKLSEKVLEIVKEKN